MVFKISESVAALSVESLPLNSTTRVRFPVGTRFLVWIPGLAMLPLSAFHPVVSHILLTIDSGRSALALISSALVHILWFLLQTLDPSGIWPCNFGRTDSGRPVLVYLSSVLVHDLQLPYKHLGWKSRGM